MRERCSGLSVMEPSVSGTVFSPPLPVNYTGLNQVLTERHWSSLALFILVLLVPLGLKAALLVQVTVVVTTAAVMN